MTVRRIRNWIVAVLLGFVTTTAAFAAGELRHRSGKPLGGIDLSEFCADRYGENAVPTLVAQNVYGWRCLVQGRILTLAPVDPHAACEARYGSSATARPEDESSPYSWRCYRD